jgi:APA family basic amino acid/polyamine antiporter
VNYRGVKAGAAAQNALTALKIAGLLILTASALFSRPSAETEFSFAPVGFSWSSLGAPMMACLFAYEGWNAVSFVAGEVRAPGRNLPRALGLGMAVVIAIFTLANAAFLRVLPMAEFAAADRVGSVVAERVLGPAGATLVSATILAAIAGSVNACLLTGPRVYFAQARDGLFFAAFGATHPRFHTPAFSIVAQGALAAALVLSGTFELLFSYATFGAWVFHLLAVGAVIVLRRRQPARQRPYRMWGYPATPMLFCAVAVGFLASTLATRPLPALTGLLLIAAGVPLYYIWRRKAATS